MAFEAHGVRAAIGASDSELFEALAALLPPEAALIGPGTAEDRFALLREDDRYRVISPWEGDRPCHELELALAVLEGELQFHVAAHAQDRIFIHAGAVVHRDKAIVIPGASFSGKTTLVSALVQAGALYYSDEFVFIDEEGFAYPYPRPLSVKVDAGNDVKYPVERLGGTKGTKPAAIGVVVLTHFRAGAEWKPKLLSRGRGAVAVLANAPAALDRPAQALAAISKAVAKAMILEGERGDAGETATALLKTLESGSALGVAEQTST